MEFPKVFHWLALLPAGLANIAGSSAKPTSTGFYGIGSIFKHFTAE